MKSTLSVFVAATLLAGCGSNGIFRDRGFDYLRADVGKPLVYPDGVRPIPAQELYPVPGVEQRLRLVGDQKPSLDVPPPPQMTSQVQVPVSAPDGAAVERKVTDAQVEQTHDGNGYPVLMLDLDFDWAWQVVGDALRGLSGVQLEDVDRERAAYYVVVDGKRNSAGEPYQLKLNYTSNGIQVALQVDDNAMAPRDLSAVLIARLRDGLLK